MICKTSLEVTQDDRNIVTVLSEQEPECANTLYVETIFEIEHPAEIDFTLQGEPFFITLISCTRTDTRESVVLPPDQVYAVKLAAMIKAAELSDPLL